MAIERLVGLNVVNDKLYNTYREQMFPLLMKYGGSFGYDFKVSEVLKSEVSKPINRVFTIFFESEELMDDFFSNDEYLKIREKYFDSAVDFSTTISKYERSLFI